MLVLWLRLKFVFDKEIYMALVNRVKQVQIGLPSFHTTYTFWHFHKNFAFLERHEYTNLFALTTDNVKDGQASEYLEQ